jgi:hypothetical protein
MFCFSFCLETKETKIQDCSSGFQPPSPEGEGKWMQSYEAKMSPNPKGRKPQP